MSSCFPYSSACRSPFKLLIWVCKCFLPFFLCLYFTLKWLPLAFRKFFAWPSKSPGLFPGCLCHLSFGTPSHSCALLHGHPSVPWNVACSAFLGEALPPFTCCTLSQPSRSAPLSFFRGLSLIPQTDEGMASCVHSPRAISYRSPPLSSVTVSYAGGCSVLRLRAYNLILIRHIRLAVLFLKHHLWRILFMLCKCQLLLFKQEKTALCRTGLKPSLLQWWSCWP